jgi:hypothetical protein
MKAKRSKKQRNIVSSKQIGLFSDEVVMSNNEQIKFVSSERDGPQRSAAKTSDLAVILESFAKASGASYTPYEWNGSATISFHCDDLEKVNQFVGSIDAFGKQHCFRSVVTIHLFGDGDFGFQYQVTARVPGTLVVTLS